MRSSKSVIIPICGNFFLSRLHWKGRRKSTIKSIISAPTGANVWLVRLWKEKSAPPLQIYQMFYGVGAAVAPFIIEPFLSSRGPEVRLTDRCHMRCQSIPSSDDPYQSYYCVKLMVIRLTRKHRSSREFRFLTQLLGAFPLSSFWQYLYRTVRTPLTSRPTVSL